LQTENMGITDRVVGFYTISNILLTSSPL
jgi:hypothetical protein